MKKKTDVKLLSQMALLVALMLVLAFTPLGFIPLGFMNATTMHIPVILGACLLGPKLGGVLGGVFGVTSVLRATIAPNLTSFVFTPFYSFSPDFHGSWMSLIVAILPRILIGVIAGYVFRALTCVKVNQLIALPVAGFIGSMVNTVGVMGLIYLLFGQQYAAAGGTEPSLLLGVIMGVVGLNGVPEAIIAAVLTLAVGKALFSAFGKIGTAAPKAVNKTI